MCSYLAHIEGEREYAEAQALLWTLMASYNPLLYSATPVVYRATPAMYGPPTRTPFGEALRETFREPDTNDDDDDG